MGGSRQGLEAAVGDRLVSRASVLDRDRAVALAPDDHRRRGPEEIQAVDGAHALAADIDDRAQGLQERAPLAGALQRTQRPDHGVEVDAPLGAAALELGGERRQRAEDPRARGQRDGARRARHRRDPQERADVRAQPAARHEHQPVDPLGELPEELHRDAAAERVADDGRAADAERREQVADRRGVGADRVIAAGGRRVAVSDQVRGDHGVVVGQVQGQLAPVARRVDHPVDQQHRRAAARGPVDHLVAVELGLPGLEAVALLVLGGGRHPAPR